VSAESRRRARCGLHQGPTWQGKWHSRSPPSDSLLRGDRRARLPGESELLRLQSGIVKSRDDDEPVAVPLRGLAEFQVECLAGRGDHFADRIGCRDPKAAVEMPPSRDHRCRAIRPVQRLDPHWRAKGRDCLLDDLHLELASVFARRESTYLPECQREVSLARESATVCDVRNAQIRFAEQLSGALDPPIQHVAVGRFAGRRVKHPEEMAAAVSDLGRELLKGEVRLESAFNKLLDPK